MKSIENRWMKLPLECLDSNPDNPNTEDSRVVKRLRNALEDFGFVQNIVVVPSKEREGRYIIIAGNHRVEILRSTEKPDFKVMCCVVPPMTKARQALLAQALNNIHGSDNREAAEALYEKLVGKLGPETLDRILGHQTLVQRVLASHTKALEDAKQAHEEVTDVPAKDEAEVTVVGAKAERVSRVEPNTLYHGDSCLLQFPKHSFDAIVTDPPYMVRIFEKAWDSGQCVREFTKDWVTRHLDALKPGGLVGVFINANQMDLVTAALRDCKLLIRDPLVWVRYVSKIPGKRLNREGTCYTTMKYGCEFIVVGQKPPVGTFRENFRQHGVGGFFFEDAVIPWKNAEDFAQSTAHGNQIIRAAREGRLGGRGHRSLQGNTVGWIVLDEGRRPTNVVVLPEDGKFCMPKNWRPYFCIPTIRRSRRGAEQHETEKRIELTTWVVKLLTPPGGLVADLFCGRATTAVAAMRSGRNFVAVEKNRKNYEQALRRLEEESGKTE